MEQRIRRNMICVLKGELVKALGCTEPIAIAYVSAKAREILGKMPEKIVIGCSGNIIKNAKSVVVPMTGSLKGIEAAAVTGAVGGHSNKELEVLTDVTEQELETVRKLLDEKMCTVKCLDTTEKLHIIETVYAGEDVVQVELIRNHLGIIKITKNGKVLFEDKPQEEKDEIDYTCLNVKNILDFANTISVEEVQGLIEEQIRCNTEISQKGLNEKYGANIGKMLLAHYGDDVKVRAKAKAAAGSDARMSGCELPVVVNSGSGNQGMTVSLPVIEYAEYLKADHEKLIRALILSNLIAIYQKYRIGRLSAYCGAVSAAAGAGAGITYLYGGDEKQISDTIVNTLANVSGIICDGASASCAAKIASSVDAAIMGRILAREKTVFETGDGIVKDNLQKTIDGVVELARDGMKETDEVILHIMVDER